LGALVGVGFFGGGNVLVGGGPEKNSKKAKEFFPEFRGGGPCGPGGGRGLNASEGGAGPCRKEGGGDLKKGGGLWGGGGWGFGFLFGAPRLRGAGGTDP